MCTCMLPPNVQRHDGNMRRHGATSYMQVWLVSEQKEVTITELWDADKDRTFLVFARSMGECSGVGTPAHRLNYDKSLIATNSRSCHLQVVTSAKSLHGGCRGRFCPSCSKRASSSSLSPLAPRHGKYCVGPIPTCTSGFLGRGLHNSSALPASPWQSSAMHGRRDAAWVVKLCRS